MDKDNLKTEAAENKKAPVVKKKKPKRYGSAYERMVLGHNKGGATPTDCWETYKVWD